MTKLPTARIDYSALQKLAPAELAAMYALEKALAESDLKPRFREMIKVRVSQINGCAFCLAFHVPKARAAGLTDRELHLLNAWKETPAFTPTERAALDFAENVTLIANHHVPDSVYATLQEPFSAEQIVQLTFLVMVINSWNRLMITFTVPPQEEQ